MGGVKSHGNLLDSHKPFPTLPRATALITTSRGLRLPDSPADRKHACVHCSDDITSHGFNINYNLFKINVGATNRNMIID